MDKRWLKSSFFKGLFGFQSARSQMSPGILTLVFYFQFCSWNVFLLGMSFYLEACAINCSKRSSNSLCSTFSMSSSNLYPPIQPGISCKEKLHL